MLLKIILLLSLITSFEAFGFDHTHKELTNILKSNTKVVNGQTLVNYSEIKKSPNLDNYLKKISSISLEDYKTWNENQKLSFLINAYNVFTIKLIIDHYPVKSIKDIGTLFTSAWKKKFFKFLGQSTHLDHIEHEMIRKDFNEPRIHFAVVCASIGCPSLRQEAFTEKRLQFQLDQAAKHFILNTQKNFLKNNTLYISKIFKWYRSDFEKNNSKLLDFLNLYLNLFQTSNIKIEYNDYDWNLNEYK